MQFYVKAPDYSLPPGCSFPRVVHRFRSFSQAPHKSLWRAESFVQSPVFLPRVSFFEKVPPDRGAHSRFHFSTSESCLCKFPKSFFAADPPTSLPLFVQLTMPPPPPHSYTLFFLEKDFLNTPEAPSGFVFTSSSVFLSSPGPSLNKMGVSTRFFLPVF